jgi:hypothetical protein
MIKQHLKRATLVAAIGVTVAASARAQQTAGMTKQQRDSAARADSIKHEGHTMSGMKMDPMQQHDMHAMASMDPLGVSMGRMGSGTTWIPDAAPLPTAEFMKGAWHLMLHGFVWGQYDKQRGSRGDEQLGSLNWGMFMASRELAGGRFQARTMLSLDPWTVSNRGYPLLLQTGETYQGASLIDRQHPHDFWMELAAQYERPITSSVGLLLYGGPSGEPALGPVAFMHRPSAMDIPFAPLSHHWQDATHVSFGVVTAGIFSNRFKLEGSVFNGREPDEERWDFDPIKLDSYSGRATFNPNANWSMSAGYGWMKSPEILNPTESMHRITASILHGTKLGEDGQVASAVVWGANAHHGELTHSVLAESEAILDRSSTLLGRAEFVQKSADELVIDQPPFGFAPADRFNVIALSGGYIRELARFRRATIGVGGMGTVNLIPSSLEPVYGSQSPVGWTVFLRLRPSLKSTMGSMPGMTHE